MELMEIQQMLQELENLKLQIKVCQEHLEALVNNKFMIGQKSPIFLMMELFQMNSSISQTQSNTITLSSVSRKNLTKNIDQTI